MLFRKGVQRVLFQEMDVEDQVQTFESQRKVELVDVG